MVAVAPAGNANCSVRIVTTTISAPHLRGVHASVIVEDPIRIGPVRAMRCAKLRGTVAPISVRLVRQTHFRSARNVLSLRVTQASFRTSCGKD